MLTAVLPFLTNKWARAAFEIGAVLLIALAVRAYYIEQGKRAGLDQAAQGVQQELEKARAEDRRQMQTVIDQANSRADEAERKRQASDAMLGKIAILLGDIARQRTAGDTKVASLPDADLHSYIVTALNLRPAGDKTPGYVSAEERAIAACVTQYPLCERQNAAKDQQLAAEQAKTAAADQLAAARLDAIAARDVYVKQLETDFAKLYNLRPPRYRSIKCLWLWKCGAGKLAPPAVTK